MRCGTAICGPHTSGPYRHTDKSRNIKFLEPCISLCTIEENTGAITEEANILRDYGASSDKLRAFLLIKGNNSVNEINESRGE